MQLAALALLAFLVSAGALFSMHLEQPAQRAGAPRRAPRRTPAAEASAPGSPNFRASRAEDRGTEAA